MREAKTKSSQGQVARRARELALKRDFEEVRELLNKSKTDLIRLTPKAVKVLERAMQTYIDTGNGAREAIVAANTSLKAVGLSEENEKQHDTQITVVLPSGIETKVIDLVPVENSNDSE